MAFKQKGGNSFKSFLERGKELFQIFLRRLGTDELKEEFQNSILDILEREFWSDLEGEFPDPNTAPVPHNAYEDIEFNRLISDELFRYARAGRDATNVKVFKSVPNFEYLSANVPKTMADILKCAFIVDKKAKKYDQTPCSGQWNSQGYPTIMLPGCEERWAGSFLYPESIDTDEINDSDLIALSGYIGLSMDKRRRDSTGDGMHNPPFRLWRFHLLNRRIFKQILRFRRDRQWHIPNGANKPKLDLKAKDFDDFAPFSLVIALPSSESALMSLRFAAEVETAVNDFSAESFENSRHKRPRFSIPEETSDLLSVCSLGDRSSSSSPNLEVFEKDVSSATPCIVPVLSRCMESDGTLDAENATGKEGPPPHSTHVIFFPNTSSKGTDESDLHMPLQDKDSQFDWDGHEYEEGVCRVQDTSVPLDERIDGPSYRGAYGAEGQMASVSQCQVQRDVRW